VGAATWGALGWGLFALDTGERPLVLTMLVGAALQVLLWRRAIAGGGALLQPKVDSWLLLSSWLWWVLLQLVLLIVLSMTLLLGLVLLAFSGSSH
jgi:hypothetical protein